MCKVCRQDNTSHIPLGNSLDIEFHHCKMTGQVLFSLLLCHLVKRRKCINADLYDIFYQIRYE